jgi:hypothetical protein
LEAWESGKTEIDLFDIHGRKIRTLWSGDMVKNQHFMTTVDEGSLPRGTYMLVITNGSRKELRRLVKLE